MQIKKEEKLPYHFDAAVLRRRTMMQWLESVHSDGSECFVSSPQPSLGDMVTIRIRMYADAPVKHVVLRYMPNGAEQLIDAVKVEEIHGLAYYEAQIKMTEPRMNYHFCLVCEDAVYYYNQKEITTYLPDCGNDFVLLADYHQPSWVKNAVFYQIFPERFCNGDPTNDVRDGEYVYGGHTTKQMKWEDRPLPYYGGYCMDFFGGDLQGIKQQIPYLKSLGVTALYLNPIFHAPSIHKYDCIDYYHVDPHFGGDEALAQLSEAVHRNGMKLILDISINHTGVEHRWFNRDCTFFDKSEGGYHNQDSPEREFYFFTENSNEYYAWAGYDSLPTMNYTCEELRNRIYRAQDAVLRKWLKPPYSIDGWRFDVADVFGRKDEIQLAHELWPEIRKSIREENPEAYILGEDWGDCTQYLQGNEWDSPMNYFGCGRVLRSFLGLPDFFLQRNEALRNVKYKMKAEDVQARVMQYLARMPFALWQNQFNLIDSHDFPRVHNYPQVHPEEYRGAVILQFMLIGTPSVYYGDEVAIDGGTEGDDGYRYPMPWGEIPGRNQETFEFYQTLMALKRESRAMCEGGMKFLYAMDHVLVLARFYQEQVVVAVMSTDEEVQRICISLAAVGVEKDAVLTEVFGKELKYQWDDEKSIVMEVKPHQAYLFTVAE